MLTQFPNRFKQFTDEVKGGNPVEIADKLDGSDDISNFQSVWF